MFKRIGLVVLVLIILVTMLTFTAMNSGTIDLDLAFFEGTYPISVVLVMIFVVGTIFGMLCMTAFVFRLIKERRALRRSLRMSESEVSSLRNLPLSDAD
jgi:putative membrane protein